MHNGYRDACAHIAAAVFSLIFVFALFAGAPSANAATHDVRSLLTGDEAYDAGQGAISNERFIELDGSSTLLATWDERLNDGSTVHFYGVSLDGASFAHVAPANYQIGVQYQPFDPLEGIPVVESELSAAPDSRLHIVQFYTQPLPEFTDAISSLGGTVRQYVAQFAFVVEMDNDTRDAVAALPFVRWVGPYQPAYRLEMYLVDNLDRAAELFPSQRYNVMTFTVAEKAVVADRIASIGGQVDQADAGKFLVDATLTPEQLLQVARFDEVQVIDRWSPLEPDMDIAREIGGANYIEAMEGFTGAGVRGEVFDAGFNTGHVDFASRPLISHGGAVGYDSHGASTSGIVFGDGTGQPIARGMLPDGQGIVADYHLIGITGITRYNHDVELATSPWNAVLQTSSVGSSWTTTYTSISADTDARLFDSDVLHCQSQSNNGTISSRPEAWAKNIISGGALRHYNTLTRSDDCWCSGASIGPAADGRIKPTLISFYDAIYTTSGPSATAYTASFGGTSGATPIICGHAGLVFQMWADGVFGNEVDPEGTVFSNRCHMTTAKAALINSAYQYPFSGTTGDKTRVHQGWGMPDLQALYDMRSKTFVVDETDVLQQFDVTSYYITVEAGEPALKVTMTYADPPGNPAVQTQHRVNDVTLRVVSPLHFNYYGNAGLDIGLWSSTGNFPDTKNTVENVFVQNPAPGLWRIDVRADEVIQDGHTETPGLDVDYALWVSGGTTVATSVGGPSLPLGPTQPGLALDIRNLQPGTDEAQISFALDAAADVTLRLFDVQGRRITTLVQENLPAGSHTVSWNGRDESGSRVAPGLYYARLIAGKEARTGKLLVVR